MQRQGRDPREWAVADAAAIEQFFASRAKHVLYFAGYGELGYEQIEEFRNVARTVLNERPAHTVLVHAGTLLRLGGHDGIAEIYRLAKEIGMETSGIHPSIAMDFAETHRVSPWCDHVFFVEDRTWGGFVDGTNRLSPTLRLHLTVSDEMVVIGGGKHAADELRAFAGAGKQVRYFPAEMNYSFTRDWAARAGVSLEDMRGAALEAWQSLRSSS